MSTIQQRGSGPAGTGPTTRDRRRVVFATVVGTAVEWYDFFIYAQAAALVFGTQFFAPAGEQFAQILAFITVGISFLFRPVGAFLAGHFGDRYGRRVVLTFTLVLMGAATTVVGLLPNYAAIGIAAPALLILMRVLQGISAGGEWGGAALLAVEHAPVTKRGLFGSAPQVGTPIGLLMASGVMALMTVVAPGEAFLAWGWRVPFLVSFVLVIVGYLVRRHVEESPVFTELAERKQHARLPIAVLLRRHAPLLIIAALLFAGNNAVGYMTTGGFIQGYASDPEGAVRLDTGSVLAAITGSSVVWLIATFLAGALSDRIGRRRMYLIGWVIQLAGVIAVFPLVNTGRVEMLFLGVSLLAVGLGFTYGPMSAFYSELFPASIRFSGISMSYAIGAILGGAFAPTIAQAIVQATGSTSMVSVYLSGMTLIGLCATLLLRDRSGIPLGVDQDAQHGYAPAHVLAKA